MKLNGKTAIVTGAASGIGRHIALAFAREGAQVAIADLNPAAADAAVTEIKAAGGQALSVEMDVTAEQAVNDGVAAVIAAFGGVDILVSNAGLQIVHPLEEFSFEEWKRLTSIHLDGAFLTTKACLPHMYGSGHGGSIIYMGSVHSKEGSMLKAPYVTAKHGVRANVICPGFVRTPLVDRQIPEQARIFGVSEQEVVRDIMLRDTVDGEFTTAEDVAEVAVLFASFPSNALTGQSLVVSHGWHMQ